MVLTSIANPCTPLFMFELVRFLYLCICSHSLSYCLSLQLIRHSPIKSDSVCVMYTDVRDDEGKSLLDKAMARECLYRKEGCVDVALYLMSRGCAYGDEDKAKLLCAACYHGNLSVVQELVELHKVDPKSE